MSDEFSKPYVHRYEHADLEKLGRNVVHDPRSRNFTAPVRVDKSTWHDKRVRLYDPLPNPNQSIGNCTGCAKAMQFNVVGNRVKGKVLKMADATQIYSLASRLDPWQGSYPPEDTGSSGLASAKAAQRLGLGGGYYWLFAGADAIIQSIMGGNAVSVGTRWDFNMFEQDAEGRIHLGGGTAGGHQWIARGYWKDKDWVLGRCWWGGFRDFWIARADLDTLMRDYGDAHIQARV